MSFLRRDQNGDRLCWYCSNPADTQFCGKCGKVQPPLLKDYFALLGLPISFRVDIDCLEKKYLYLQQQIHPDRFVGRSTREKRYASQQSSVANQAYEVLKDPIQRGYYLLNLQDKDYGEDQRQGYQDPEYLMMVLLEQESIENTTDLEEVQESVNHGTEKLLGYEDAIRQAFEDHNFETALTYLNRYQYQRTLIDKARKKFNQLRN